uniref:Uncharacterized protein n=1 Tax=Romanomermis culicivorax TaxID=13658 RepID=A0A915HSE3_ROMCU
MNKSYSGCEIISLQLAEKAESTSRSYTQNEERMVEMNATLAQLGSDKVRPDEKKCNETMLDDIGSVGISNEQNLTGILEVSPDWNFKKKIRQTLIKIINSPCYLTNFMKIRRAKNEYRTALKLFE